MKSEIPSPQPITPSPSAFMREAIGEAHAGAMAGHGGPFGSVIVKDGQVIGRGHNQVVATCDPTAHAEIIAIREACRALSTFYLAGCELYTSCQPCPMCLAAIYWARLDRFYYACTAADAAAIGFADDEIHRELVLPDAERAIPALPLLREEALITFAAWHAMPDRVPY